MKNNNIKSKFSNEKGITLVALIITVVVMGIIAGISINTGTKSLDSTRLQGFYMQLETIQKRVDDIVITDETYIDSNGNTINIKENSEFKLTASEKTILENILSTGGIDLKEIDLNLTTSDFRYFTVEELETVLDLKEMEYNVFIHFDTRTVIAQNGITINNKTYYILENNMYYPVYNTDKNQGVITSLSCDITKYGTQGKYKIVVFPSNTVGDLTANGTLQYKKTTSKYWETANGLEIIISELTQYDIKYVDSNKNTVSETIIVALDDNGVPTVTVNE